MSTLTERIEGTAAFQVLRRSVEQNRLAHGILLHGESITGLEEACLTLAAKLLEVDDPERVPLHPDFFTLRPANKMRRISVEATRDLIHSLNQTANQGPRKVGVVHDADRMRRESANAFLKTLEEPPGQTTLFLLTTRPYDLLPTIRSRCLMFRLPAELERIADEAWQQLLQGYGDWIVRLSDPDRGAREKTPQIIEAYGFVTRFGVILEQLTAAAWEVQKKRLPEDIDDAQKAAIEAGLSKGIRNQLLTEIENATRSAALQDLEPENAEATARKLSRVVEELEGVARLLELNLNAQAALEHFLLRSVKIWAGA
ncbi:MAG: DNA polymerase III subunit gamma/tau [Opitutales bacterium]